MNILLIGLRGAGKTTVGREVARRRSMTFIDLDERALKRLGAKTVAEAWAEHGRVAFRRAEADALLEALENDNQVIALGGGAPTAPGAAETMKRAREEGNAKIIYLRPPVEKLQQRVRSSTKDADPNRPSLTGADPVEEMAQVFAERDPLYRELADLIIEDADTVEDAAKRAEELFTNS